MAGQNVERREILRVFALAAGAAQFPGFQRWAFACPEHSPDGLVKEPAGSYQRQFFTSEEYGMIETLTDLIVPNDGTPGAKDAGVAEFIDFMTFSDPEIQFPMRYGVGWLDARARGVFNAAFMDLNREQQSAMLRRLAYKNEYREGDEDGRDFFKLIREYTMMGFYTSRIGQIEIDNPNLKTHYDQVPDCPHVDDREHKHLSPPRK
jgi:gluconate 2-dehydrogenase subunit 3-like protein